jgi:hypothetical protein
MVTAETQKWYHSNQYTADSACPHCEGVVRHEPWCITGNCAVAYAYQAVVDAAKLSLTDELILHALGVAWKQNACNGGCSQ